MRVEKDFVEFLELLNDQKVKYLIVGAYALALYAEPRNTGDIDFFVDRSEENAHKILTVLKLFGFEGLGISIDDLTNENMVVQLGVPPVRIDILSSISGVDFDEAYSSKIKHKFGNTIAFFLSKEHLIKNKIASGRKKDLADLEALTGN
ncbi:MAG: nucleotidyltransferase [Bacteroidetes bacterium]|nr:nucleotidyltransferase [Bacteroidota bacterium]MBU1799147.1 nucleotidyltransferase [Bacteroidota bacterium]